MTDGGKRLGESPGLVEVLRRRALLRGGLIGFLGLSLAGILALANRILPIGSARIPVLPDPGANLPREGRVKEVLDGDTLELERGGVVRLNGIDAPEEGQRGHDEAAEALRAFVLGHPVRLEPGVGDAKDRYGRWLAFVEVLEVGCVNEALLRSGRVWIYRLDIASPRHPRFLSAQREAMDAFRGIWAVEKGEADPLEGRPVSGNRSSRIFHRLESSCLVRGSTRKREAFESLRRAFRQGYSPCRRCFRQPLEGF